MFEGINRCEINEKGSLEKAKENKGEKNCYSSRSFIDDFCCEEERTKKILGNYYACMLWGVFYLLAVTYIGKNVVKR